MKHCAKLRARCGAPAAVAAMAVPKLSHAITKAQYINVALRVQLDVQRRLHEQLKRTLQLRIEAQGKKLQKMFDEQLKARRIVTEQPEELQGDGNGGGYYPIAVEQVDDGGKASGGHDDTGSKTGPRAGLVIVNRHRSAL